MSSEFAAMVLLFVCAIANCFTIYCLLREWFGR